MVDLIVNDHNSVREAWSKCDKLVTKARLQATVGKQREVDDGDKHVMKCLGWETCVNHLMRTVIRNLSLEIGALPL